MNEDIITDIQETLAHHEHQISDLNDVIISQGEQIDLLKAYIKKLQNKIEELEHTGTKGNDKALSASEQALRDKPPHY